jgi:hypothetical protein
LRLLESTYNEELPLSKLVKKSIHVKETIRHAKDELRDYGALWSVRNPIDRAISALDMANTHNDRKQKHKKLSKEADLVDSSPSSPPTWREIFYEHCGFGSAQDLADAIESDRPKHVQIQLNEMETMVVDCIKEGRNEIEGHGSARTHLFFNYAFYKRQADQIQQNPIYVLRTEHLWEDVIQTNRMLLGTAVSAASATEQEVDNTLSDLMKLKNSNHMHTHGSEGYIVKSRLNQKQRETFCCYLSEENQIYENLLWAAVNLSSEQKFQTMMKLYQDCGILPPFNNETRDGITSIKRQQQAGKDQNLMMLLLNNYTSITTNSSNGGNGSSSGFMWKEWRSRGCPSIRQQPLLTQIDDIAPSSEYHDHDEHYQEEILNLTPEMQLFIPERPDPTPTTKLINGVGTTNRTLDTVLSGCKPTSQVRLDIITAAAGQKGDSGSIKWILQALDEYGLMKRVGGDEFYISLHHESYHYNDSNPQNQQDHPMAVAEVTDLGDGRYELDFVQSPMDLYSNNQGLASALQTGAQITLTVHFVYTCGVARLSPPSKEEWTTGGFIQTEYTVNMDEKVPIPPIRPFIPPSAESTGLDLESFDHVVFIGDSLMQQFGGCQGVPFHSSTTIMPNVGKPLNTRTVGKFFEVTEKGIKQAGFRNLAVVIGSSTWDILADDVGQGETFFDHCAAMRTWIEKIRTKFPNVTLIWKSGTALHTHIVVNKRTKMFGPPQKAMERIKYMSSTRSRELYEKQKEICRELDVPFLDVYDAYYLSGDFHYPTDGRHYRCELNQQVFNRFYSKPQNPQLDYRFKGY